jgi:hypothetical protein
MVLESTGLVKASPQATASHPAPNVSGAAVPCVVVAAMPQKQQGKATWPQMSDHRYPQHTRKRDSPH